MARNVKFRTLMVICSFCMWCIIVKIVKKNTGPRSYVKVRLDPPDTRLFRRKYISGLWGDFVLQSVPGMGKGLDAWTVSNLTVSATIHPSVGLGLLSIEFQCTFFHAQDKLLNVTISLHAVLQAALNITLRLIRSRNNKLKKVT